MSKSQTNAASMPDKTDAENPSPSPTPHNSNQYYSCLQLTTVQAWSAGIATGEQVSRENLAILPSLGSPDV